MEARMNMLSNKKTKIYDELHEGDMVRIPVIHKIEKGYKKQWSYQTHKVEKLLRDGLYQVNGEIYPRKELSLVKKEPVKNIPLEPNVVKKREKENQIGVAQNSKLLKELADFNAKGKTENKVVPGSRRQVEHDISAGRALRSKKSSETRVLRSKK